MTTSEIIRARVDDIVKGPPEDAYDSELIRLCAIAWESQERSIVIESKKRLMDRFRKDFTASLFKTKIDEYIYGMKARAAEENPGPKRYDWELDLKRVKAKGDEGSACTGPIVLCESNLLLYLERHPAWANVLGFNEFRNQIEVLAPTPAPVNLKVGDALLDHHDVQAACWFQNQTSLPWRVDMTRRCLDAHAHRHSFSPLCDFLDGVHWDGIERVRTAPFVYLGVGPAEGDEDVDPEQMKFQSEAFTRFMIGAVARARNPGCQNDHVLVLEGGEGIGKSSAVKILGRGFAKVLTGALDGKPAMELMAAGAWLVELPELASLKRASEVENAKAFITKTEDEFRPAYGHRVMIYKRHCALIATVNGSDYLDSPAWEDGKRRMWPLPCRRPCDLLTLDTDADQLWAEADHLYKSGHRWHFDPTEDNGLIVTARVEQAARVPDLVQQEDVILAAETCAGGAGKVRGTTTVAEILTVMKIPFDRWKANKRDVELCLKAGGWILKKVSRTIDPKQPRRWFPPASGT